MTGGAEIVAEPLSGHPLPARLEPETVSHLSQPLSTPSNLDFSLLLLLLLRPTKD